MNPKAPMDLATPIRISWNIDWTESDPQSKRGNPQNSFIFQSLKTLTTRKQ
jgi:hypothetical protein